MSLLLSQIVLRQGQARRSSGAVLFVLVRAAPDDVAVPSAMRLLCWLAASTSRQSLRLGYREGLIHAAISFIPALRLIGYLGWPYDYGPLAVQPSSSCHLSWSLGSPLL